MDLASLCNDCAHRRSKFSCRLDWARNVLEITRSHQLVDNSMTVTSSDWFYGGFLDIPFIVTFSVFAAILLTGGILSLYFRCKRDDQNRATVAEATQKSCFVFWFLFELIILCARFNFMLAEGSKYQPFVTADDQLVYPGPHHLGLNSTNPACRFSLENATVAPKSICRFGLLDLSANLMTEVYVKISVGLGLIVFILLQGVIFVLESLNHKVEPQVRPAQAESASRTSRFMSCLGQRTLTLLLWVVCQLLASQQSCVLLALVNVHLFPECAVFTLPLSAGTKQSVCFFKWAAAGIPFGIPLIIGGVLLLYLGGGLMGEGGGCGFFLGLIVCAFGVSAGITGIGLFGFWLVAGLGIGVWFHYGTTLQAQLIAAEVLGPAAFVVVAFTGSAIQYFATSTVP
eukprot:c14724_g1_i1.p1 GENE.c14724_g1_i1~~c14724_g1_i1.p1  ORF type:complete len:400 (+),score=56.55 c14724_g1_i1:368-1567(+)